jgi:large subunit ribosomal protein L21
MYAIIRAGGKQSKVREGDVIDVERIKSGASQVTFTPLLLVDEDGNVVSERDLLAQASVTAEVVGESRGPKIDVFTYKNKSGSRRRQGHRQTYTTLQVTGITAPSGKRGAKKPAKSEPAARTTAEEKPAPKAAEDKQAAMKAAAEKTATEPVADAASGEEE